MADPALLEARAVAKRFGPVVALKGADLVVGAGEAHALLGANGAGKSTLVKILTGVLRPDTGTIRIGGAEARVRSPAHAARLGLAPVFQDPALVPDLTIAQNLRLTQTPLDEVRRRLAALDVDVDFSALALEVPLPVQRMIDLARALAHEPKLLILDEITAALPSDLAERVFSVMRELREQGRSVLFITHRLNEVIAECHGATVLRDGASVATLAPRESGVERIVAAMLGEEAAKAEVAAMRTEEAAVEEVEGPPAIEVRDLRVGKVGDLSFSLREGEILGIAALEGQGQDELFAVLAGERRPEEGEIVFEGRPFSGSHPYDAIRRGVALVPADRLLALLPQRPIHENLAAPRYNRIARWGPINLREERRAVRKAIEDLQIDTRAARQVRRLSGGNQQKVTIGRWLASGFRTLLCFDPTRGIDVGTKRQIYALLRALAAEGAAVLFFSSELTEFPLVCDRVITLYGGRATAELAGAAADEASLLHAMHGLGTEVTAV